MLTSKWISYLLLLIYLSLSLLAYGEGNDRLPVMLDEAAVQIKEKFLEDLP